MKTPKNELVEVEPAQTTLEACQAKFRVPADLPLFRDHFETSPVLPAFFIVDFVVAQVRAAWPGLGPWRSMPKLKLLLPLQPDHVLVLKLRRSTDEVQFSLAVHSEADDAAAATGVLRFAPSPGER